MSNCNMTRLVSDELNEALEIDEISDGVSLKDCQEKLGEDFPSTRNFMTILYNLFTSPNREMKESCYISSIISTHFQNEKGKKVYNDYDHNDLYRFVATLLVCNEKNVILVPYKEFKRTMLSKLNINKKNFDSFFEQIKNARLPQIDVDFTEGKKKLARGS